MRNIITINSPSVSVFDTFLCHFWRIVWNWASLRMTVSEESGGISHAWSPADKCNLSQRRRNHDCQSLGYYLLSSLCQWCPLAPDDASGASVAIGAPESGDNDRSALVSHLPSAVRWWNSRLGVVCGWCVCGLSLRSEDSSLFFLHSLHCSRLLPIFRLTSLIFTQSVEIWFFFLVQMKYHRNLSMIFLAIWRAEISEAMCMRYRYT